MLTNERYEEVITLCQQLVKRQSYSGQEGEVAAYIQAFAETLQADAVTVDAFGNVLVTFTGTQQGPTIVLDGHIDTVPITYEAWQHEPLGGQLENGKIYGRGTTDMKGAVSAMLLAAQYVAVDTQKNFRGSIIVSCSVHEECFEGVATRLVSEATKPDYVVIGEATNLQLNRGQRGRAEIVITTYGKAAHSSNPTEGINAVYMMTKLIDAIRTLKTEQHTVLGEGILELTDIQSAPYPGASVVPSQCKATFDRRLLVGETRESVLAPLQAIIDELTLQDETFKATVAFSEGAEVCYTGATIAAERFFPAWLYEETNDFVEQTLVALQKHRPQTTLSHYSFCTNGSHFAGEAGIPTIGYGPSLESLAHIDDEYIEITQLTSALEGYYTIIEALQKLPMKAGVQYV